MSKTIGGSKLLVEGTRPEPLERDLSVIGTSVNRLDGLEKVTGRAKYSSDISLPGMLHAKIVRSPHAHARIRKIDISKAAALPGVFAILTREDAPDWHTYWYMASGVQPQPAFPDVIGYAGQEVAAIAAADPETAIRAAELIEIDYEVLPAVFTPEVAKRSGAPIVATLDAHQDRTGNVQDPPFVFERGNVTAGFGEAEVTVEDSYRLPTQFHMCLQTRCCIAYWDGDTLTVYESSQGVWNVKRELAKSLGLPEEKVRVIVQYQGGGFGSKAGAQRYAHYAAKLSMMTKRPVRLELTRREEFLSHPRRYPGQIQLKLGAKRDGTLCSISFSLDIDLGVGSLYRIDSHRDMILNHVSELYKCPNVRVEVTGVYTNTPPTGAFRGVLNPSATFAMEASMDHLASELGMDPVELRMKNYTNYADEELKIPYSSKHLDRCIQAVTEALGWERRADLARLNQHSTKKKGIGLACYTLERSGYAPFEAKAQLAIRPDGTVELRAGIVDIGSGQVTVLAMIAAEELGVEPKDIKVIWGDTGNSLYAPSSHASRITIEMGPATLQAAALARQELFRIVASYLEVPESELESAGGRIYVKTEPSHFITFADACRLIPALGIHTVGSRAANPEDVVFRLFGAQGAEIELDTETGEMQVMRIVSAHDIGRALNPKLVRSQQYGGVIMALGWCLYEEAEIDQKTGILLNADAHQYRVPTALEVPDIEPINVESEDSYYPYSAKPAGEAPFLAVSPAVRNAIFHACGVAVNELPISIAQVFDRLREHQISAD